MAETHDGCDHCAAPSHGRDRLDGGGAQGRRMTLDATVERTATVRHRTGALHRTAPPPLRHDPTHRTRISL
ncbi:hypothetical protein [Streptomyces sp. NPDC015131]|uniref:hypothetical protein n=1 Tax=Streptomyces sp. NPDC015131 TaxID=3364941 RepID=UPI0036F5D3A5